MNIGSWMLWGFIATTLLTTIQAVSQGLRLTRMSFPLLIGTFFTANRDRARLYGTLIHFLNGWALSLIYVLAFESLHRANWWIGSIIGVVHAMFWLAVFLPIIPGIHPRMASEQHGPTATRHFEPPGFLGLNYGVRTPVASIISHIIFGAVLGAFYHLHP